MRSTAHRSIAFLLLSTVCGCGLVTPMREAGRSMVSFFTPHDADYGLAADEEKEQWDVVGEHARTIRKPARDPERFYKNYIQSEEARDIERSLGIE